MVVDNNTNGKFVDWIPPTEVGGCFKSNLQREVCRNLWIPQTAVCGLFKFSLPSSPYKEDSSWGPALLGVRLDL